MPYRSCTERVRFREDRSLDSRKGGMLVVMRIGGRADANSGTHNAKDNAESQQVAQ